MSKAKLSVSIRRAVNDPALPKAAQVRHWLNTAYQIHPPGLMSSLALSPSHQNTISVSWVNAEESQKLNLQFRGRDAATNVLSFAYPNYPLGDLVLCAPVLHVESQSFNKTLEQRAAHLIVHGYLHLIGFEHDLKKDQQAMESLETKIMAALDISDPYAFD